MSFAESFVPEFKHEMSGVREILELVPDELLEWKAHDTLNSIRWVASHLVDTPSWAEVTMTETRFDINPPGGQAHEVPLVADAGRLVVEFDETIAKACQLFSDASDADYQVPWTLLQNENELFTMPRQAVVKMFFLNHMIHHRAFLIAYLRMNGIECPGIYG